MLDSCISLEVRKNGTLYGRDCKRFVALDLLRIVMAAWVFLFHSRMFLKSDFGFANGFAGFGYGAMTGFFMLSGFVLEHVYGGRGILWGGGGMRFYKNRMISLWPCYIGVVAIYLLCIAKRSYWAFLPIDLTMASAMFSSLVGVSHVGTTWFVSCIFLAYLAFPLLDALVHSFACRGVLILIVLLLFGNLYSLTIANYLPELIHDLYSSPFFRGSEFLLGVLLARFQVVVMKKIVLWLLPVLLSLIFLSCTIYDGGFRAVVKFWSMEPLFAVLILVLSIFNLEGGAVLRYLGGVSYAFYLAQLFCFRITRWMGLEQFWVAFGICFAIAVSLHECIEKPVRRHFRR